MPARSLFAKDGIRLGKPGSLSDLAFAFPLAAGLDSADAHTDAACIGFYADRTAGTEHVGIVVLQTNIMTVGFSSLGVARVRVNGAIETTTYFRSSSAVVTTSATISTSKTKYTGNTPGAVLTLPDVPANTDVAVRNAGSVDVTVAATNPATIEGAATFVLHPGEALNLTLVGTVWTVF